MQTDPMSHSAETDKIDFFFKSKTFHIREAVIATTDLLSELKREGFSNPTLSFLPMCSKY